MTLVLSMEHHLGMGLYEQALDAFRSGDTLRARELSEELAASGRLAGDSAAEVDGLCMLSRVALREHRLDQVEAHARAAREVASAANEARLGRMPLHMLAVAARMSGDQAVARRLYEESIELNRSLGEDRMVAAELHNLAYVELHDGNVPRARELFEMAAAEALRLDYKGLLPYLVADRAVLAAGDGDFVRSAILLGSAQAAFAASGQVPDPDDASEQAQLRERLDVELGSDRLAELLQEGGNVALENRLGGD